LFFDRYFFCHAISPLRHFSPAKSNFWTFIAFPPLAAETGSVKKSVLFTNPPSPFGEGAAGLANKTLFSTRRHSGDYHQMMTCKPTVSSIDCAVKSFFIF
jgi:hypothetical protein